jgi:hypothetical protein
VAGRGSVNVTVIAAVVTVMSADVDASCWTGGEAWWMVACAVAGACCHGSSQL